MTYVVPWKNKLDRAAGIGYSGPRLRTGFAGIDEACRGGMRQGLVVIGGAPGAGKTGMACQLAVQWATEGHKVHVLAYDESADGLLIRIGQQLGFDRTRLEEGDPVARAKLRERLDEYPNLELWDACEDKVGIEDAAAYLASKKGNETGVLIVDSIQRAFTSSSKDAQDRRAEVDDVVNAAVTAAKQHGLLVIGTSEVNRAAYRLTKATENSEPLSWFKETGGVEYGAHMAICLRSVQGMKGQSDVIIAKNRWSGGTDKLMRVRFDFISATFSEVEMPSGPLPGWQPELNGEAQLGSDMEQVRKIFRKRSSVSGMAVLKGLVDGISNSRKDAAISALKASGELVNVGDYHTPVWRLMAGGTE